MTRRLLTKAGVDAVQWRALVAAYLRIDLRRGAGAARPGEKPRSGGAGIVGLLVVMAMTGLALSMVASVLDDPFVFATLLTTYGALNTGMLLLVDFTGLVVSPDDYRILGCRPIASRTYFAARLTAIAVYVATLGAVLAFFPALSLWLIRDLGVLTFIATMLAVVLCNLNATVLVIAAYAALVGRVHPRRLTRTLSYLQLGASMLFLGGYYLATVAFQQSTWRQLSFSDIPWLWFNPAAWFAAFIAVAAGTAGPAEWTAAAGAVALAIACVPLAAGRLSLGYAERLSEIAAVSEPARSRRAVMTRVPGFGAGEAHSIALLVRAQFRFDTRFRLAILGMLPLTAFYVLLALDGGALADPFAGELLATTGPMYFAIVFLPMTLHSSLQVSDSWRAAWIFFAAPADPAKLIVAAKNFVSLWFLGGYLTLMAVLWSFFYDSVWHAVVHAFVIGLLAHLLLQAAVIVRPSVPFASEPRQAERTFQLFLLFIVGGVLAGLVPIVLPFVYVHTSWTAAMVGLLVAITAAIEYALRLRAREAVAELEFKS